MFCHKLFLVIFFNRVQFVTQNITSRKMIQEGPVAVLDKLYRDIFTCRTTLGKSEPDKFSCYLFLFTSVDYLLKKHFQNEVKRRSKRCLKTYQEAVGLMYFGTLKDTFTILISKCDVFSVFAHLLHSM